VDGDGDANGGLSRLAASWYGHGVTGPDYDLLFGDAPLDVWSASDGSSGEPWRSFAAAREAFAAGRSDDAVDLLQQLVRVPGMESRHYLQAWHVLRAHGVQPDADAAKQVYGAVVELPVATGHDVLAVYADYTARYLNYSGAAVIWDARDPEIDAAIDGLLQVAAAVVDVVGPWEAPRLPPPGDGVVRFSMLTPSGLHFGEGPLDGMAQDPMGAALLHAAEPVALKLIEKGEAARG